MHKKPNRQVIAKVYDSNTGEWKHIKYYSRNIVKFVKNVIEKDYSRWAYMNVFDKETGEQIANFTCKNPPYRHV